MAIAVIDVSPSSVYRENGGSRAVSLSWSMSSIPAGATINSIKLRTTLSITRTANHYARIQNASDAGVQYLSEYRSGTYTSTAIATSNISSITLTFRADTGVYVTFDALKVVVDYTPGYSASTVNSITAEAGQAVTFTVTNSKLSVLKHKIRVTFRTRNVLAAEMDTGVGTSDEWTIPEDWLEEFTDSSTAYGTIICETYSGTTLVGTKNATIRVDAPQSAAPTVTLSASHPTGEGIPWGMYLQILSGVVLTAQVTTKHLATATEIVFSDGIVDPNNRYQATVGSLGASGENTFTVTVRDSRGLTTTASVTITVVPYSTPTFESTSILRCDQNGNTTDQQGNPLDTGTYVLALADVLFSSCEGNNALSIALDVDVDGVWVPVDNLTDNVAKVCSAPPTSDFPAGFDPNVIYTFRIKAVDSLLKSVERILYLRAEAIFMHIRDDETGMALGMVSTRPGMEINPAWPVYMHGKEIIDLIYPVGAIYMSATLVDPAVLFGGTWARIEDTFLLAAGTSYAAGDTGGEATHTLTANEIAPHMHPAPDENQNGDWTYGVIRSRPGYSGKLEMAQGSGRFGFASNTTYDDVGLSPNTGANIGGQAHNNMPPYLAVYMWKRTA